MIHVNNNGDGIPDSIEGNGDADGADKCPRLAGSPLNAGCPVCDTDGDGVTDEKDKCPTIPGPIQHLGCPAPDTVYIIKEAPVTQSFVPAMITPEVRFSPVDNKLDTFNISLLDYAAQTIRNSPAANYVISGYSGPTKL